MTHSLFGETWDYIFSIGTKCNTHAIRQQLGLAGYSSPFDSMDSVNGLRDCAHVLTSGDNNYFEEKHKWILRNDYASRSSVVRSKALYHCDYPGLFYPHFYSRWFEPSVADQLDEWIRDPRSTIDLVWSGFSSTFARRLERLKDLMRKKKKILFLRVDDKNSLPRIYSHGNTIHDLDYFASLLLSADFCSFQLLYVYAFNDKYLREAASGSHWHAIGVDTEGPYDELVSKSIAPLKIATPSLE